MFITPLGHTECLIEIPNNKNELVRILIDSWFSDVCVGDLMARRERVRFDYDTLPRIDYILGLNQLTVIRYPIKWLYGSKNDLSKKIPNLR